MNVSRDPDQLISVYLEDGIDQLPDRAFDAVRSEIDHTRQRVVFGPWKEEQMRRYAIFGIAAAAIVLVAVVGIQLLPRNGGIGGQPTATPTIAPSPTPSPTATAAPTPTPTASPVADPIGLLTAGNYVAHPFPAPNRTMSFNFDVASDTYWDALGDPAMTVGINRDDVGLGFLQVSSLNGDPCTWAGEADDVAIGPTADDLATALASATGYVTSEASEVSLSGYSGKKVVVTMPGTLNPNSGQNVGCDDGNYRIWNATGFDIYAQGPENRWTIWILDVIDERVVVMTSDYATTSSANRAELESIVNSIVITP